MYRRRKYTLAVCLTLYVTVVGLYLRYEENIPLDMSLKKAILWKDKNGMTEERISGERKEIETGVGQAALRTEVKDTLTDTKVEKINKSTGQQISWTEDKNPNNDKVSGERREVESELERAKVWPDDKDQNTDKVSGQSREVDQSVNLTESWTEQKDSNDSRTLEERRMIGRNIDTGKAMSWKAENDTNRVINQTHVLINGYMRSGSTFIGSLFNSRRDTFYWFEPLWRMSDMEYYAKNGLRCSVKVPACSQPHPEDFLSLNRSLEFLVDLYNCSLENHMDRFVVQMMGNGAKRDLSYRNCRKSYSGKECYIRFIKTCLTAKHIVTKTVRLDVHLIENLLTKMKTLKVLQLMRDPRAIINSRIKTAWYPQNDTISGATILENEIKIQCERMRSDLKGAEELAKRYPNRVKILQYEDMLNLREKAHKLYHFLGMDDGSGNDVLEKMFETTGLLHTDSYRTSLAMIPLQQVQRYCSDVIKKLGLRTFSTFAEMKTSNISSFVGNLPFEL